MAGFGPFPAALFPQGVRATARFGSTPDAPVVLSYTLKTFSNSNLERWWRRLRAVFRPSAGRKKAAYNVGTYPALSGSDHAVTLR